MRDGTHSPLVGWLTAIPHIHSQPHPITSVLRASSENLSAGQDQILKWNEFSNRAARGMLQGEYHSADLLASDVAVCCATSW
jgi:hypothetical protein